MWAVYGTQYDTLRCIKTKCKKFMYVNFEIEKCACTDGKVKPQLKHKS